MQKLSVPVENRFKYVLSKKSATSLVGIYSLDLIHTVLMEYLCVDNHGIVTLQTQKINFRRPLQN